jgi:hypothetical protein
MQAFLSCLTSVLLLVQALTGWCCHHCTCADSSRQVSVVGQVAKCCGGSRETAPVNESEKPCKENHCSGFCTFLPIEKCAAEDCQLTVTWDALFVASTSLCPELETLEVYGQGDVFVAPPLRLHLLNQNMLI